MDGKEKRTLKGVGTCRDLWVGKIHATQVSLYGEFRVNVALCTLLEEGTKCFALGNEGGN